MVSKKNSMDKTNSQKYFSSILNLHIIFFSSSLIHKKKMTKKNVSSKQECVDEVDSGTWESEAGSPNYDQLDEPPNDPLETSTNASPSPRLVQSHLKVLLVERNGTQGETEVSNGELKTRRPQTELKDIPLVIPASSKESLSTSSTVSQPTVVLPRHIPVMQVSSYQSSMRRVASEPNRTRPTPGILRTSSTGHSPGRKLCIRTTPVKTEINLSPTREGSVSPGSKEMLAANVLSGRFYQDEPFI